MRNLADHLFDVLENSVKAGATEVKIFLENRDKLFFCKIEDNGSGIKDGDVTDPFITSRKTRRVGLGLPLLKRAVESTGGFLKIRNRKKRGIILKFKIDIAHIDAKPFGDIARAFVDAIYSWPEVSFSIFIQKKNKRKSSVFNSKKIREVVSYSEMQQKEVRDFIYDSIDRELKTIRIDSQFGIF
ncbi:MAG TPA: ATP-binding protein [Candidatus Atribacteria bacterium]|nr:ATP-binding protein [Candidatus Atribacteria bacterium]